MSYLVLARKYRPQTFDQVVEQAHVTRTLKNAIDTNRVAHAVLFSGPRGTGKTTVARILAKAMNCQQGPTSNPCNTCRSCREITQGNAVDVFEIDGASNNSVDQVRELRENLKYMPAHSPFKIYIIDEVHMLSISAFNALLKTLEEPPAHVMFLFATTEPHKIPVTIMSRCQRHDFRRISLESIITHLQYLSQQESRDTAPESLDLLAREAGGSMRDAMSLLDQVMTCSDTTIHYEDVLNTLGVMDRKQLYDISEAILHGDAKHFLTTLDSIYERGHDIKRLYIDLIEHFRNLLVVKINPEHHQVVHLPSHELVLLKKQTEPVSETFLSQVLDLLFREESAVKYSSQPRVVLELVILKILQIRPTLPIGVLIEKLDGLKNDLNTRTGDHCSDKSVEALHFSDDESPTSDPLIDSEKIDSIGMETAPTASSDSEDRERIWFQIHERIAASYPALAANLMNSRITQLSHRHMEIEASGNGYNLNMIQKGKNLNIIKEMSQQVLDRQVEIDISYKEVESADFEKKNAKNRLKNEALKHPVVADAIEIFNGKILDVKIMKEDS